MLQALEAIDERRARVVLSRASEGLLAPWYVQGPPADIHEDEKSVLADILIEVGKRVDGQKPRNEEDRRSRMLDAISKEISEFVFARSDPQTEIRRRLGTEGRLPASLFSATFSPKFEQNEASYGVSRNHTLGAISKCDMSQHFRAVMEMPGDGQFGSLFVQRSPSKGEPNIILVKCSRIGDQLLIDDAFRIFETEVDLSKAHTPLDILKQFVDRFGLETELIGGVKDSVIFVERDKFFHERIFHIPEGGYLETRAPFQPPQRIYRPDGPDDRVEVDLCFTISMDEYVAQLKRHGVKAAVTGPSMSMLLRGVPFPR